MYDYPPTHVATLTAGLPAHSRVKRGFNGITEIDTLLMLTGMFDNISMLLWSKTNDGQKGRNKPKSVYELITKAKPIKQEKSFESVEDFEKRRQEILRKIEKGGT